MQLQAQDDDQRGQLLGNVGTYLQNLIWIWNKDPIVTSNTGYLEIHDCTQSYVTSLKILPKHCSCIIALSHSKCYIPSVTFQVLHSKCYIPSATFQVSHSKCYIPSVSFQVSLIPSATCTGSVTFHSPHQLYRCTCQQEKTGWSCACRHLHPLYILSCFGTTYRSMHS